MSKYIFVVGGVYSGTGKGISGASIGFLLLKRGASVQLIKCDPYLNTNAGTMNPRQHGEVFLCNDGSETDLDLGHYERITGIEMSSRNIFTSGTLHQELLADVEAGKYLGQTIQVIPHVTDRIKERITSLGQDAEIVIAEIGGTVGDMESEAFYDAARQMKQAGGDDVLIIMVAPIIWNAAVKESKTKPLQNAVKALQMRGLQPDILLCRTDFSQPVGDSVLQKISTQTGVDRHAIFLAPQVRTIYEVPIKFWETHVDDLISDKFHLRRKGCQIYKHRDLVEAYINGHDRPVLNIGVVGKYENQDEAYLSLKEALVHAAVANQVKVNIKWIDAEDIDEPSPEMDLHAVIVPGGFDQRGVHGKLMAISMCRREKIPFLGICLGLQCAVIHFCREVMGIVDATSEEFNPDAEHKVIHFMEGQSKLLKKSGTMRLGSYDCQLTPGSLIQTLYSKKKISERHRHRYEVNSAYVPEMERLGLKVTGKHIHGDKSLVEMIELDQSEHPFFVATQSHPEFKSRLDSPAPLFNGLVKAAAELHRKRQS